MLPVHFQSSRRLDLDRRLNLTSRQQVQIPKLESLFLILDDPDSGTLPRRIIIVDRTAVRDHPLEQAERGFPDFGTGRAEHGGEVLRGWVVQAANDACRWEEFFLQAEDAFVGDAHVSDDGGLEGSLDVVLLRELHVCSEVSKNGIRAGAAAFNVPVAVISMMASQRTPRLT